MHTVDILLSTYNGEQYLAELLASIEKQTVQDYRLLIRDDGSIDGTWDILTSYSKNSQSNVHMCRDRNNLGVTKSFNTLLQLSEADYIMFCDQDDVWYPQKVSGPFNLLKSLKKTKAKISPYLFIVTLKLLMNHLVQFPLPCGSTKSWGDSIANY